MALLDELGGLSSLWGSAVAAWSDPQLRSRPGGAVQYLWGAYSNAVAQGYLDPIEGAFGKMNLLSSASAKLAGSSLRLMDAIAGVERSGTNVAIDATHWAHDIDHAGVATSPFEGTARIRMALDVTAGGVGFTQWFTWRPGLEMPRTVGGLLDALQTVLAGFAEDYNVDSAELGGTISIAVA